jgi:transcriptional regulator with XRE-family HTH domain
MDPEDTMPPRSSFTEAPPFAVEDAVRKLGANIRTARLRRNLTMADVAAKLGVSRRVIAEVENGKVTTAIGTYVGMLWAMDLMNSLDQVADPKADEEGLALAGLDERERARSGGGPSNAF